MAEVRGQGKAGQAPCFEGALQEGESDLEVLSGLFRCLAQMFMKHTLGTLECVNVFDFVRRHHTYNVGVICVFQRRCTRTREQSGE